MKGLVRPMNSRITGHDSSVWKEVAVLPGLSKAMNSHIQDSDTFQTPKVQAVLTVPQSAGKDGGQSRKNGGSCLEAVVHVVWRDTAI